MLCDHSNQAFFFFYNFRGFEVDQLKADQQVLESNFHVFFEHPQEEEDQRVVEKLDGLFDPKPHRKIA